MVITTTMGRKTHTRESIIQTLQSLAQRLKKDTLCVADLHDVIPRSSVKNYFGSFGNALDAAGLRITAVGQHFLNRGPKYSDARLFQALGEVEQTLGREPGYNDFQANGKVSVAPFKRFGTWDETLAFYRKWKNETGGVTPNADSASDQMAGVAANQPVFSANLPSEIAAALRPPLQFYGEPIDFRGLRHAPIKEQGVVYLFGMVSRELGFYIESVQVGFPDCEGKYLHDRKRSLWAMARIEFEFRATNFRQHGHDPNGCDFIVCWENDWPECPINVIELRKEILKLPSN